MELKSLIFEGQVRHKRYHQKKHQFKYNVFNMLIDIDDLKYLDKKLNLFSFNKFNIFSFYEKDHGLKNGTPVKDWILKVISKSDIDIEATINLVAEKFGHWDRKPGPEAGPWQEPPLQGAERRTVQYPGEEQVQLAFRTAPNGSADKEALILIDMILDLSLIHI